MLQNLIFNFHRQVFDIKPIESGATLSRTAKKQTSKTDKRVDDKGRAITQPKVRNKYLGLMRKFEEFAQAWTPRK